MMQVEAVLQMLQSGFDVRGISAKRRNKSNPWFKRRTLHRSAVDVLRRATGPMTAREIAEALIAGKAAQATRKQAVDLQAAILVALRKRKGVTVIGEGAPALAFKRGRPSILSQNVNLAKLFLNLLYTLGAVRTRMQVPLAR
jgi:hypothetical protein